MGYAEWNSVMALAFFSFIMGAPPHPVALDDGWMLQANSKLRLRQHVKLGITGWAQIKGLCGETAKLELMEERIANELWYVKNWSISLDHLGAVPQWLFHHRNQINRAGRH